MKRDFLRRKTRDMACRHVDEFSLKISAQLQELAWKSLPRVSGRCSKMLSLAVAAAPVPTLYQHQQLVKCEIVMDRHPAHSIRLTSLRSNIHLATFHSPILLGVYFLSIPPLLLCSRNIFRYQGSDPMRFYESTMRYRSI